MRLAFCEVLDLEQTRVVNGIFQNFVYEQCDHYVNFKENIIVFKIYCVKNIIYIFEILSSHLKSYCILITNIRPMPYMKHLSHSK